MINEIHTLEQLMGHYETIINFRKRLLTSTLIVKELELFFGNKISCASCPTAITKAVGDYERVVFSLIYKKNPALLIQPDRKLLEGTRFTNGMYETLVTSSFDLFVQLLDAFIADFKSFRIKITEAQYNEAYDELIRFNLERSNYFVSDVYLAYKRGIIPEEVEVPEVVEPVVEPFVDRTMKQEYVAINQKALRRVNLVEATKLHNNGSTYDEIAAIYGVTRQAVYKLFKKHTKKD